MGLLPPRGFAPSDRNVPQSTHPLVKNNMPRATLTKYSLLVSLVLTCLVLRLPAAENWPQFRGPAGAGRADGGATPVRWSETENIRWKTPIHGKGWPSPVIWGDQIWLTT